MAPIDCGYFRKEEYVPTLRSSDDNGIVDEFIQKLRGLRTSSFDQVVKLMGSINRIVEGGDLNLHQIKCIYHELQCLIDEFNRCTGTESGEEKLVWLQFFMDLTRAVNFRENSELWQAAAFMLLEEALNVCGDAVNIGDYFNLLIHFRCFEDPLSLDLTAIRELERRYQNAIMKIFLSFIAQTTHKASAFSSFPYSFKQEGEPIQAEDFIVGLCKEATHSHVDVYPVFRILKQLRVTRPVIHAVVQCLCSKLDRVRPVTSELQTYLLGLIISMDSPTFWSVHKDKVALLCQFPAEKGLDFTVDCMPKSKQTLFRMLDFWRFQIDEGEVMPSPHRFLFSYFFVMFDQIAPCLDASGLMEILEFFHSNMKRVLISDEIQKCLAGFIIYLLHQLKYNNSWKMAEEERLEAISLLSPLFIDCQLTPIHLRQGLLNVFVTEDNPNSKESFRDCFTELANVFHFTIFEDRRDLGFTLLASRKFKDNVDELVELCPTPVLYRPPNMDEGQLVTFQRAFSGNQLMAKDKQKVLDVIFLYFRVEPAQVARIVAWICGEANQRSNLTLPEYKELLKLLMRCVGRFDQIELSDTQRAGVVKALKPGMYACDFRLLFNRNEPDPYKAFVHPTMSILQKLVEVFNLHNEDIIENHYLFWNAAIAHFLTRVFPRLVIEADSKRPQKRKGKKSFSIYPSTREKFIKDACRLPFERLQKELIDVGNACMDKLEGHTLYGRCSHFHLASV